MTSSLVRQSGPPVGAGPTHSAVAGPAPSPPGRTSPRPVCLVESAEAAGLVTARATARRRLRHELDRLESVRAALATGHFDEETEGESISEISSVDQHPADIGTETFEREKDLSLLAEVEDELADVHRALVRLDRGIYGSCEACGRPIPDERLAARPASRFCVEDQAACEITAAIRYVRRPTSAL